MKPGRVPIKWTKKMIKDIWKKEYLTVADFARVTGLKYITAFVTANRESLVKPYLGIARQDALDYARKACNKFVLP